MVAFAIILLVAEVVRRKLQAMQTIEPVKVV